MDKQDSVENQSLKHLKQSYLKCSMHSYKKRAEQLKQLR